MREGEKRTAFTLATRALAIAQLLALLFPFLLDAPKAFAALFGAGRIVLAEHADAHLAVERVDDDARALEALLKAEQLLRQRVEHVLAHGAPHRPRAVGRVVPGS